MSQVDLSQFEGFDVYAEEQAAMQKERELKYGFPWAFQVEKGRTKKIILLDKNVKIFPIHEFWTPEGKVLRAVCTQRLEGSCPLCDRGHQKVLIGVLTAVEVGEFKVKIKGEDTILKNPRRLVIAKQTTLDILQKRYEKYKTLQHLQFDVSRSNKENSPSSGDDWEYDAKLTEAQIIKLTEQNEEGQGHLPIDYAKYFETLQQKPETMISWYNQYGKKKTNENRTQQTMQRTAAPVSESDLDEAASKF